jgi:hypothetical protein
MFGIQAHDIARQYVDGEIWRELRNVLAAKLRNAVTAIVCHGGSPHIFILLVTRVDHHRTAICFEL